VVPEISSISVSFSGSRQDLIDALLEELAESPIYRCPLSLVLIREECEPEIAVKLKSAKVDH
jgi:hypothetical protein